MDVLGHAGLAFVVSLVCVFIIRNAARRMRVGMDQITGVQKYHARPVPRLGGAGIYITLLLIGAIAPVCGFQLHADLLTLLGVASIVFFVGLAEDLTRQVGSGWRYFAAVLSAFAAAFAFSARLTVLDVPLLDTLLQSLPLLSLAFTAFAVAGVAHSMNLVDGSNGLASFVSATALLCVGLVAQAVGEAGLAVAAFAGVGAVLGFLVFNFPRGHIFLGDAGAYLLGFLLAQISVLLAVRHPEISPWFPLLVLIYPIWETLFTMFRRIVLSRTPFMEPDNLHLHQILYRVLLAQYGPRPRLRHKVRCNAGASMRLWPLAVLPGASAVMFYQSTGALLFLSLAFVVGYVLLYRSLMDAERAMSLQRAGETLIATK